MTINVLLIVFGFSMGYIFFYEWIIRPLRKKIERLEKDYRKTLQESLDLLHECSCNSRYENDCFCGVN